MLRNDSASEQYFINTFYLVFNHLHFLSLKKKILLSKMRPLFLTFWDIFSDHRLLKDLTWNQHSSCMLVSPFFFHAVSIWVSRCFESHRVNNWNRNWALFIVSWFFSVNCIAETLFNWIGLHTPGLWNSVRSIFCSHLLWMAYHSPKSTVAHDSYTPFLLSKILSWSYDPKQNLTFQVLKIQYLQTFLKNQAFFFLL